jgi:hypothetical protein
VHDHGQRRRHEECVAEEPEAVPGAVVEPYEEDAGQHEVPEEVEDVQHLEQVGHLQKGALQRGFPREARDALEMQHRAGVRECLGPVGHHQHAGTLVGANRCQDDTDLRQAVAAQRDSSSHRLDSRTG